MYFDQTHPLPPLHSGPLLLSFLPNFVFCIFLNLLIRVCAVHILLDVGSSMRVAAQQGLHPSSKLVFPIPTNSYQYVLR